ncbi:MAG TPA: sigma-70 family RNA polymerase sigma factor [Planctomycetota bacterium]
MTPDPELLLAHGDWLRRLARQLAGDPHLADDVVQDAWAQALVQPPRLASAPGGLRAWLATVVRNSVRMHRRSARRRAAREALAAAARATAAPSGAERLAGQQRLLAAVQALPAADRDVLLLRYFDELQPRVIAQRLGTTSASVRSRLSRALATLRSRLAPEDDPRALAFALLPVLGHGGPATARTVLLTGLLTNMAAKLIVFLGALGLGLAAWLAWPAPEPPVSSTPIAGAPAPAAAPAVAATPVTTSPAPAAVPVAERQAATGVPAEPPPAAPAPAAAPQSRFTVVGRCVDEAGRALPGARLVATNVRDRPSAVADDDGRVALEIDWPLVVTAANPSWLMLEATADRRTVLHRQERMPDARPESIALGDLVLVPGGALAGLVLDADGKPAAKVHVYLVRGATPASDAMEEQRRVTGAGFAGLESGHRTASTDDAGRYRFEGVPATGVSVVAVRRERLRAYTPPVEVVAGGAVEAPPLTLATVPAANVITGVVRDADGQPLAGAEVNVFGNRKPRNVNAEARAVTTPAGAFEVAVLSGAQYSLAVKRADDRQRELVQHDVAAGSRGVELVFAPARTLEVLVTGPDGEVVTTPAIHGIDEQNIGMALRWREAQDGAQATIAPERPFSLLVSARGYQQKRTERFDPAQLPPRITVTLARAAVVAGRVLANGAAVAGAKVHAHRLDPQLAQLRFAGGLTTRLPGEATAAVTTDADGRFALPISYAGRYVVHAESAPFGRGESAVLDVAPERAPPPVELELLAAAAIDGVVLVAQGDAREGLVVGASRGDGHVEVAVTGADGAFRFTGLAAGPWQVRVCKPEDQEWLRQARTWPQRGDKPAQKADVELRPGETASHRIDLAALFPAAVDGQLRLGGATVANARISMWCDGEYRLTRTDDEGRFRLRGQAAATTLHAFVSLPSGGELQVQHALQLTAGANPVSLDAPVGAVDFTGLSATPPAEDDPRGGYALVWTVAPPAPRYVYRFEPGPDGVHRAPTLPAGRAQLRRRDEKHGTPDSWPLAADVEVVAREHRVVTGK